MPSSADSWAVTGVRRWTPPETGFSRRSMAQRVPYGAAGPSSRRCGPLGLDVRAGVHTGEVEVINGKVGGLAVNIGARVAGLADSRELLVSSTVKDLTAGSGLVFEDAGVHELKGIPEQWHLYRVRDASS